VTIDGWSPRDFEDGFLGQITLSQALAHSINTVAAKLADDVGRDQVAARRGGWAYSRRSTPSRPWRWAPRW